MQKMVTASALLALIGMASACNRESGGDAAKGNDTAGINATGNAAGTRQASASAEAEVRGLLDRIYAPYATDDARDIDIASFMEPQLAAAMSRTEGGVDADPFIDAQDYAAFRPTYEGVAVNGDRAEATASFNNMGNQTRVNYQLVRTPDGWKVADIRSAGGGSFRSQYGLQPLS